MMKPLSVCYENLLRGYEGKEIKRPKSEYDIPKSVIWFLNPLHFQFDLRFCGLYHLLRAHQVLQ